jgi:hypothetical protein
MGVNNNPSYSISKFDIQAHPEEHHALIQRQGQASRIMQSRKCPCLSGGRAQLLCNLCKGKGYLLTFQRSILVIDEQSPHCELKVNTFWSPILAVNSVLVERHASQGGNVLMNVDSFSGNQIDISHPEFAGPKNYETTKATYRYDNWNEITGEQQKGNGSFIYHSIGTKSTVRNSSNPFNIHGDLVEVTRVYNVTKDINYDIKSFKKQTITIDDKKQTVEPPEATDDLEFDYKYVDPIQLGTDRIKMDSFMESWNENSKTGQLQFIIPAGYEIAKGDVITLMVPRLREDAVIIRGSDTHDEIPQFDIVEILSKIIDEDGQLYESGTDFSLEEYNNLVWKAGKGPAAGKNFSISYVFRPSFRIYKQVVDTMSNENKYFPQMVEAKFMNKFTHADMVKDF